MEANGCIEEKLKQFEVYEKAVQITCMFKGEQKPTIYSLFLSLNLRRELSLSRVLSRAKTLYPDMKLFVINNISRQPCEKTPTGQDLDERPSSSWVA